MRGGSLLAKTVQGSRTSYLEPRFLGRSLRAMALARFRINNYQQNENGIELLEETTWKQAPFSGKSKPQKIFAKFKRKGVRTLMKNEIKSAIKELSIKTEKAANQDEAMKYAQAALNLANVLATLESIER